MTKDEKKDVLQKLKRAAVIAASAVTGLTAGGCATNNKKDDAVANNDIVFVEEQTEATTPVDTIETTTTTAFSPLNKDSNRKKSYDDDSADSEYVETSYENDFTTPTTITSIKNSNKKDVVDDNTTAKTNSKTSTTTAKTNEKNPNTKIETNTKNPTTTAKANEKQTTPTTTKATTKPTTAKTTTTVTTTTTEAVTEPPVTEPQEPEYDIYDLNNIGVSKKCFDVFVQSFKHSLLTNYPNNMFFVIDIGYGETHMGFESSLIIESLNNVYCDNEYINTSGQYANIDADYLNNCKYFMYNFKVIQDSLQCDVDYSKYTINKDVGNFLNEADQAYRDGNFDQFMSDTILCGNVSPDVLDNPGAMAILYSYDNGKFLNYDDVDSKLSIVVSHICEQAYGYTK